MSEISIQKIYACFPGGKHKVLTMSYDDGKVQDRKLVSIFNKYGIKGTPLVLEEFAIIRSLREKCR